MRQRPAKDYVRVALEYLWRFGVKSLKWVYWLWVIFALIWFIDWVMEREPTGWSIVAILVAYGIWEISRTLRSKTPNVTVVTGTTLQIKEGAVMSVSTAEFNKAVDAILAQRDGKPAADD